MQQYLDALRHVQDNGRGKADRTGTGTRSVFGYQMRFNLADGFPLLTTKKLFTRGIITELLWILSGDTNEHTLRDQNVNIWKEWAHPETGELGRIYGAQWRAWTTTGTVDPGDGPQPRPPLDQMKQLVNELRFNPTSRRHIVTAWNPGELDQMALPPCHMMFQFYCEELTEEERRYEALARGSGLSLEDQKYEHPELGSGVGVNVNLDDSVPRYRLSCQLYQRSDKSAIAA